MLHLPLPSALHPAGRAARCAAAAILLASGCGPAPEAPPQVDTLPVWTLEPDLRIGSVDQPDYAFSAVVGMQVGANGSIYSLHRDPWEIRVWTADGQAAGNLGGTGQGPGEFNRPRAMGWQGDSIWVFDSDNRRVSFFDPDGAFLGSLSPRVDLGSREQADAGVYPPRPREPLADGTLLGDTPLFSDAVVRGEITEQSLVRMSGEGEILDTLSVVPVGPANVLGILRDGGGTFTSQPFADHALATVTADGTALVVLERAAAAEAGESEFHLTKVSLAGETVWTRAYPYEPRPLPGDTVSAEVDRIAASLHEWLGERRGTTVLQWEGWVREALYLPEYFPPVSSMLHGRDGTIWLSLRPRGPEGPEWLAIAQDGEPIARVRMPDELTPHVADRGAVWGVETDPLEVPFIVRYRIVR